MGQNSCLEVPPLNQYIMRIRVIHGGLQINYIFPNGWGASCIQHNYSYGGDEGQWEIALTDADMHICYDLEDFRDVVGYVEPSELFEHLHKILSRPLYPIGLANLNDFGELKEFQLFQDKDVHKGGD